MTIIFRSIHEWRKFRKQAFFNDKTLGFVPTMGNLHAGHRSLLESSLRQNDLTVLSIFINPTQFNNLKDLASYPKTLQEDIKLAEQLKVDYLLIPTYEAIYPDDFCYKISENNLSKALCGKSRPEHFEGVLTVVLKLLMLVKAQRIYFGKKDYQQFRLIKDMAKAFFLDVEVIACKTIRTNKGLALSSRNNLLTPAQLETAHAFPKLLNSNYPIAKIMQKLVEQGFTIDYIEQKFNRIFGAVFLDEIRLIDNFLIKK